MKKRTVPGGLYILLTALLWSTAGLCVKLLPWSAFSIASVRGLLCGLLLLVLRLFQRPKTPFRFSRQNVLAGFCMFATSTLYMLAIKMTTAANAIVLQYIAPIFVLLYSIVVQKKRPSRMDIGLTIVVFAGCVLSFAGELQAGGMLGNLFAVLSGVALAGQILSNRDPETVPRDGLLIGCGLSFLVFLPSLVTDPGFILTPQTIGIGLFLGLVQYGVANLCFAKGILTTDAVRASLIFTIEPILTPVWVFLATGERPTGLAVAGLICVVSAVTLQSVYPLLTKRKKAVTE